MPHVRCWLWTEALSNRTFFYYLREHVANDRAITFVDHVFADFFLRAVQD